jgi:hypothetical protein
VARTRSQRNPAIGTEAVQLFGLIPHDATQSPRVPGADLVPLREVAAVTRLSPYARLDATSDAIGEYRRVVEESFRDRPVVPAPFGTVFRSRDSLLHWMELHYGALLGALSFVHDRAMARLRVVPHAIPPEQLTETVELRATDFETTVFDSFRFIKRNAVACVMFNPQSAPERSVEASFLVDREKWPTFEEAVREERLRLPELAIEQSGPWPPYDFVRLQFGA